MNAQSLRLNLVASNISNANSVSSSLNEVYKSRQPVFAAQLNEAMGKNSMASGCTFSIGHRCLGGTVEMCNTPSGRWVLVSLRDCRRTGPANGAGALGQGSGG